MIIGIGTDLCHLARIEHAEQRFGKRFLNRIYTAHEQQIFASRAPVKRIARMAMFFAAKEAAMKAIGTGMRQGVTFRQIEVRHQPSGKPYLQLFGAARVHAERLTPKDMEYVFHLSLTDEWVGEPGSLAQAVVILEARPAASNVTGF